MSFSLSQAAFLVGRTTHYPLAQHLAKCLVLSGQLVNVCFIHTDIEKVDNLTFGRDQSPLLRKSRLRELNLGAEQTNGGRSASQHPGS